MRRLRFALALSVAVLTPMLVLPAWGQTHARPPEPTQQQIDAAESLPFWNPNLPIQQRVDDLVSRLTLLEKNYQLTDRADAIPRLGIPSYGWWNEGLHGFARAGYATMFPQAIGNAATWDAPLIHQIGVVVSTESRAKNNDALAHGNHDRNYGLTIWSPNINIFRDPRWGRGQETYGEDPFLTSSLGTAYIQGLQGDDPKYFRTIATPKHYAVHSGPEATRHMADVDLTDHDLWDTYLPAFRAAITQGKADSIMCSYNAVDHVPACANTMLLKDILRNDWGFGGYVTSDCDAIDDFSQAHGHHYAADHKYAAADGIRAGTDLDCGFAYHAVPEAIERGVMTESELTVPLERLFTARMKLGMFDPPDRVPYRSIPVSEIDSPEHRALALRAARESMVLLKNEHHVLPLAPGKYQTIAVIGPLAASRTALEGNYNATPRNPVLPLDAIAQEYGDSHIVYGEGSPYVAGGYIVVPRTILHTAIDPQAEGLTAEYFTTPSVDGMPSATRIDKEIDFDWASVNPVPGSPIDDNTQAFAVRWTGTLGVPVAETYTFQLHMPRCYPCNGDLSVNIWLDGKQLEALPSPVPADFNPNGPNAPTTPELPPHTLPAAAPRYRVNFTDTKPHQLRIEYIQRKKIDDAGLNFLWRPRHEMLQDEAVALAKKSDVVVAFVGLTARLEGEEMNVYGKGFAGGDRTDIVLPDVQEELLETIARKTGKPMIVVLLNGSALAVNWAKQNAKAILEAWYPGEVGGQAIAEALDGKTNPAGRLPITFYTGIDQLPAFDDYSMTHRTYRYYSGKPLFSFGDGLSYTSFAYSNLKLSRRKFRAGQPLTVSADITNTGPVAGDEIAELYITTPHAPVSPTLQLAGFDRVHLSPGEKKHVSFVLDPRAISQVDDAGNRSVVPGTYRVSLGGSQPSGDNADGIRTAQFTIEGNAPLAK